MAGDSHTNVSQIRANRFAKKKPIVEALGQIRATGVLSLILIQIRVIRVQSSLLSQFLEGRFAKRRFFEAQRLRNPELGNPGFS